MPLSFPALVDAALGSSTAWNVGKREGRADKIKENQTAAALARQATLDQMNMELHKSQIAENESLRQQHLTEAAKLQYELDHPKPVAPVLGSPEYRQAMKDVEGDKAKITAATRPKQEWEVYGPKKQEWEVYGPSADRSNVPGMVSAGDARKNQAKKDFVANWVAASDGDPHKAVAFVESTPAEKEKAANLGVTRADWLAGQSEYKLKQSHAGSAGADDLDSLAGDGAPVATAPSSAPQPARTISSTPTARALESAIPSLPPAVVTAGVSRNGTGTPQGQKPPAPAQPTSTPRSNPMRANSPKVGTPSDVPKGADPDKYRNDPRYKRWVDSLSSSR